MRSSDPKRPHLRKSRREGLGATCPPAVSSGRLGRSTPVRGVSVSRLLSAACIVVLLDLEVQSFWFKVQLTAGFSIVLNLELGTWNSSLNGWRQVPKRE